MAKVKISYKCTACGATYPKYGGKCTAVGCGKWNTIVEDTDSVLEDRKSKESKSYPKGVNTAKRLIDIDNSSEERFLTGMGEFDRVLGGGMVKGSISILTAPPGTGKSTLILQISQNFAKQGIPVVYASGEESDTQIKLRSNRILTELSDDVYVMPGHNLEDIFASVDEVKAGLLIVDSIQTCTVDYIDGKAGGNAQLLECSERIRKKAKSEGLMVVLIGQMTKKDELAGSRQLEHLVDAVFEFEAIEELRMLRGIKNRFGSIGEVGMFEMDSDGLNPIDNPSKYFLTERDEPICGSALGITKEGTRPIVVEVECATSKSLAPFPARYTEGLKKEKLNIILTVLESSGVNFYEENVIVKPTGGLRLNENATDLSIVMSIMSAKKKMPIPQGTVFIGEIGLTGEIKKVPAIETRLRELDRMGFKEVIVPNQSIKGGLDDLKIKVTKMKTINDCIRHVFKSTPKK